MKPINKTFKTASSLACAVALFSGHALAQTSDEISVELGGFTRVDYGLGDRYPEEQGEDRIGVSKAALSVTAKYENIEGVFVAGTEVMSDDENDGNIDIKDAFIVFKNLGDSQVNISVGAQPLLFGLKPAGYPGDHSLQASIEYGAGGLLQVSNQAGPAIIASADVGDVNIRGGFFEMAPYTVSEDEDGASLTDSFFIQAKSDNLAETGIYAVAGLERLFLNEDNDGELIITLGAGWKNEQFDVSVEYFSLDDGAAYKNFFTLSDDIATEDETYWVIESSFQANEALKLYADYSQATEIEFSTYRLGLNYQYNRYVVFSAEYAKDELDSEFDVDADSFDFRVELSY